MNCWGGNYNLETCPRLLCSALRRSSATEEEDVQPSSPSSATSSESRSEGPVWGAHGQASSAKSGIICLASNIKNKAPSPTTELLALRSGSSMMRGFKCKKNTAGEAQRQNVTNHIPANHRQDCWSSAGADININLLTEQLEVAQPS